MGLLQAGIGALGGNLGDQWKEMIYCDALDQEVLVAKGSKRTNDRSSNTHGDDNIISNGSLVVVNNGQCMIIVEQGKVVEVCAEPGEFVYDTTLAPSVFAGPLGTGIVETFNNIGKRFSFGGDTGVDQRVYYFNTKEIIANKYGTVSPVPFRVVDRNIGLDIDISVRCNGEYSYKIVDPILFYTNVCGNVDEQYARSEIASQLKSELLTALQPAFARVSAAGVRYSAIPAHAAEMADVLNEVLSAKWGTLRGLEIVSFGVNAIAADEEDEMLIKNLQKNAALRDPTMAAAVLAGAQADAMVGAANNEGNGGAFMAFAGMNMAANAGGMNSANLFQMGQQGAGQMPQSQYAQAADGGFPAQSQQTPMPQSEVASSQGAAPQQPAVAQQPVMPQQASTSQPPAVETSSSTASENAAPSAWTCECGTQNTGKFCFECGSPRPAPARYRCDKCGWTPADQTTPPKFCPECGDRFDEGDRF